VSATPAASATAASSSNPLSTDLQNLAQALQSNNLSAAQSAFAQLQKDASQGSQQLQGHHHHHHHGGGSASGASATASSGLAGSSNTGGGAVSAGSSITAGSSATTGTTGLSLTA
jgi:hypothetical protein